MTTMTVGPCAGQVAADPSNTERTTTRRTRQFALSLSILTSDKPLRGDRRAGNTGPRPDEFLATGSPLGRGQTANPPRRSFHSFRIRRNLSGKLAILGESLVEQVVEDDSDARVRRTVGSRKAVTRARPPRADCSRAHARKKLRPLCAAKQCNGDRRRGSNNAVRAYGRSARVAASPASRIPS